MRKGTILQMPESAHCGIYMLINTNNCRVYIGKTQSFRRRSIDHFNLLTNGTHYNKRLQNDFNKGHDFVFVVLDDKGMEYRRREMLLLEMQYMLAFLEKSCVLYNHETKYQLRQRLYFEMVFSCIDQISKDFQKKYGCSMASLCRCRPDTLVMKFESSQIS